MHIEYWWESRKERDHLGDLRLCDMAESNVEICLRAIRCGVLNWTGLN
jgi:hypothetical protein